MMTSRSAKRDLSERHVAILVAPRGTEHIELTRPREAVEQAGAQVTLVGSERGGAQTVHHDLPRRIDLPPALGARRGTARGASTLRAPTYAPARSP